MPTSITLGCVIDDLVCNGFPDEALSLVREIKEDEVCKDILNTVIYSTLLKGFAQARQPARVQDVFEEMKEMGIACNTVSYNTMLDANARTGKMDRADELFREMVASGVSPDVITYSTLVKGYCQAEISTRDSRCCKIWWSEVCMSRTRSCTTRCSMD